MSVLPPTVVMDEDARGPKGLVYLHRLAKERIGRCGGLVVVGQEADGGCDGVARPLKDVEKHRMAHPHVRDQHLRLGSLKMREGLVRPQHDALGRLLLDDLLQFLRVIRGLLEGLRVFDLVLGRLNDDVASGVETGASRAPRDLVEFPGGQMPRARAVEFRQGGEEYRADRHVDADAQCVRSADDL